MTNPISLRMVQSGHDFDVVHIEIAGNGIASIADGAALSLPPGYQSSRGVVLSGKAPGWLFGLVSVLFRNAPWRAVFDPRPGLGAVVFAVDQHQTSRRPGDIISTDMWLVPRQ